MYGLEDNKHPAQECDLNFNGKDVCNTIMNKMGQSKMLFDDEILFYSLLHFNLVADMCCYLVAWAMLCSQVPGINLVNKYSDCNADFEMLLLGTELHPELVLNWPVQN